MSIYAKLAKARMMLQETPLQKSGRNHFIKIKALVNRNGRETYDDVAMPYFELGDFLPHINRIFQELGLCGITSFTTESATLTIFDAESDGKIEFTSPMPPVPTQGKNGAIASNNLMQSIGALETYQRRYLYVMALEIVENDVIDAQDFSKSKETNVPKAPQKTPQETLQGFIDAANKAQSREELEKYWKAISQKLQGHQALLTQANDHYQARKGDFDLAEM